MSEFQHAGGLKAYSSVLGQFQHGAPPTKLYLLFTSGDQTFDMIGVDARVQFSASDNERAKAYQDDPEQSYEVRYVKRDDGARHYRNIFEEVHEIVNSIYVYH